MGRPGMKKAFLKSAMRKPGAPVDEAEGSGSGDEQAAKQAPPSPSKKAAAAAPVAAPAADNSAAADANDNADENDEGPETRGRMVQRHKREAVALKKRAKGSKAEAAKAMADLEARHAKELADLDRRDREGGGRAAAGPSSSSSAAAAPAAAKAAAKAAAAPAAAAAASTAAAVDRASKYLKDATLDDGDADDEAHGPGRKQTKAQKRREKAAAKESERDARIAAERAALGPTERAREAKALARLLLPLGLALKDVRADGNCMYHSVADQLEQHPLAKGEEGGDGEGEGGEGEGEGEGEGGRDFLSLRRLAASHMRRHRADFEPFVAESAASLPQGANTTTAAGANNSDEEENEEDEKEERKEKEEGGGDAFEAYVAAVEGTSAWGGHVELTALAGALRRRIRVVAAGMPEVWAGEEHGGKALTVCYVRHEFGLGEHYNSVRPREEGEEEEGGGSEDEEEGEGGEGGGGASDDE